VVEDVAVCPSCSEPVSSTAKFCGECGHKMITEAHPETPPKDKEPVAEKPAKETVEDKVKKTVKVPSQKDEDDEGEDEPKEEDFDYSKINPAQDWECWGHIEPDHTECKKCKYNKECAKESGVSLEV
jgi:hypothetical protein